MNHKEFVNSFNNAVYMVETQSFNDTYVVFKASLFAADGIRRELDKVPFAEMKAMVRDSQGIQIYMYKYPNP